MNDVIQCLFGTLVDVTDSDGNSRTDWRRDYVGCSGPVVIYKEDRVREYTNILRTYFFPIEHDRLSQRHLLTSFVERISVDDGKLVLYTRNSTYRYRLTQMVMPPATTVEFADFDELCDKIEAGSLDPDATAVVTIMPRKDPIPHYARLYPLLFIEEVPELIPFSGPKQLTQDPPENIIISCKGSVFDVSSILRPVLLFLGVNPLLIE